ncbi:Uncharacterised protein [Serratia rubidaea]|uniref:DUF551 domain-containing protein n=1 Tax=Serratia rubidaea TaxID=61652 RepID=A0A3S4FNW4_SERRU|nr:Uncharacterised protein [Serratia rubidaea]
MIFKLEFLPSSVTPPPDSQGKKHLVICDEGDYFLGHPMFDNEGDFLCFIVDEIGDSGFPFHQDDYVAWASLPDTDGVTER